MIGPLHKPCSALLDVHLAASHYGRAYVDCHLFAAQHEHNKFVSLPFFCTEEARFIAGPEWALVEACFVAHRGGCGSRYRSRADRTPSRRIETPPFKKQAALGVGGASSRSCQKPQSALAYNGTILPHPLPPSIASLTFVRRKCHPQFLRLYLTHGL